MPDPVVQGYVKPVDPHGDDIAVEGYYNNGDRKPGTPGPSTGGFGGLYSAGKDFVGGLYSKAQVKPVDAYHQTGPGEDELRAAQRDADDRGLARDIDMHGAYVAGQNQDALGAQYRDVLAGKGLSVAAQQQAQGQAAAERQGIALAASARGGAGAQLAASQNAIASNAAANQGAISAAAQLRAGEQATARQQYGGLLGQQRTQSFDEQRGLADLSQKQMALNDARYQWLRDIANQGAQRVGGKGILVVTDSPSEIPRYVGPIFGKILDASIDKALAESGR